MRGVRRAQGFTLVELVVAIGVIGILASIATTNYLSFIEKARVVTAVSDIKNISLQIDDYEISTELLPDSLADVEADEWLDPWGNAYEFLDVEGGRPGPARGKSRKDRFLVPINSDYDLYSMGKDGKSVPSLQAKTSQDDVIRAYNGTFLGLAKNF